MEVVYDKVKVTLKDQQGNAIDFRPLTLYEWDDEIRLTTSVINDILQRGWIGDLTYQTVDGMELYSCDDNIPTIENTFNDVLLSKINLSEASFDGPCIWEYVFLKK